MKRLNIFKSFVAMQVAFSLLASQLYALNPQVEQLVKWETKSNNVSVRSDVPFKLENYEIPAKLVGIDFTESLSPELAQSLVLEKNGEKYVRWLINPEDTKWYKQVEAFLTSKGASIERHQYFTAYQTASRSMIIEDPITGAQFSSKVSTNKTGGHWNDKVLPVDDAFQIRMVNEYVKEVAKNNPFKYITFLEEPAGMYLKDINQAMLVRDLGDLNKSGQHYYLPGFSAMHDKTGRELAKLNGSNDPEKFWNENYNKPLARALAEFSIKTGLTYDSPHSQNFMIELDKNLKPTGKIVLRDFGDTYALKEFFEAQGRQDFLAKWDHDNIISGYNHLGVGIMHGNDLPSWLSESVYSQWGRQFYQEADKTFAELTGISMQELGSARVSQQGRYFGKDYPTNTSAWKKAIQDMARKNGVTGSPSCNGLLRGLFAS